MGGMGEVGGGERPGTAEGAAKVGLLEEEEGCGGGGREGGREGRGESEEAKWKIRKH